MEPTAAPVVDIEIGGKTRKLFLGFRALKKIGANPFDPKSFMDYFGALDIDRAVALVEAGLENAETKVKITDNRMTADEILDEMDLQKFTVIINLLKRAAGLDGDSNGDGSEDPQTA